MKKLVSAKQVHYPEEFRAFKHSKLLQLLADTASKPQLQLQTACPDNCDDQSSTADSEVYYCFIFTVAPVAVSLSHKHPENKKEIQLNTQFLLVLR